MYILTPKVLIVYTWVKEAAIKQECIVHYLKNRDIKKYEKFVSIVFIYIIIL